MKLSQKSLPLIFLLFVTLLALSTITATAESDATVHNLDKGTHYTTIAYAISNASAGDTIVVDSGTYRENLEISTSITLMGSGTTKPVIDGQGDNGIVINADDVHIRGLNITNCYTGIAVLSDDNVIEDCNISGSESAGILTNRDGANNYLANNNLTSNYYGMDIRTSGNTIVGNNVTGSGWYGISVKYGTGNRLYKNILIGNYYSAYSNSGNYWNSASVESYIFKGVTYTNKIGNYWGNYDGADFNNDGIGDTLVTIGNADSGYSYDYYPMIIDLPVPPKASFTINATGDYAPFCVQFTDTSKRYPTSWHWEFGDGATSDMHNPVHIYTTPGVYLVNLTATNEYGSHTIKMADTGKCIVVLEPLPSALAIKWAKTYPRGAVSSTLGYAITNASDGGFGLAGYYSEASTDLRLIKADSDGDSQWDQVYATGSLGSGNDLVPEDDGGFTFTGENNTGQIIVTRTHADGSVDWTTGLANTNGFSPGIAHAADGGYVVSGGRSFYRNFGGWSGYMWVQNVYLARLNADGTLAWEKTFGNFPVNLGWQTFHPPSRGYDVLQSGDEGYVVAGLFNPVGAKDRMYLVKTDSNGNFLWNATVGEDSVHHAGNAALQTDDCGYLVTGYTWTSGQTVRVVELARFSPGGSLLWNRSYAGYNYRSMGDSLMATSNGNYVIAGQTITPDGVNRPYLIEVDGDGNTQWEAVLNFSIPDHLSIAPAGDDFVIGGSTGESGSGIYDAFMMKIGVSLPSSPVIEFNTASVTANEGTTAHIMLHRSGDTSGESSVLVSNIGGTAIGSDYTMTSTTVTFDTGIATQTIDVDLVADHTTEGPETLVLGLSSPTGATVGTPAAFTLTIADASRTPDSTPPVTTCTPAGTTGAGGWYTGTVTASLDAVDSGNGVAAVNYRLDATTGPWTTTSGGHASLTISSEGTHTLYYWSSDADGNDESIKSQTIKVDTGLPVVIYTITGTYNSYLDGYAGPVNIDFQSTDSASGVQRNFTQYMTINLGTGMLDWQDYGDEHVTLTTVGTYTLRFASTDYAGHTSYTGTVTVKILAPTNGAQIISLDCPATMPTEQTSKINVTVRNTGTTTWTSDFFLKMLGDSMSTPNELMAADVLMERNKTTVAPGECVLYTFSVTPTWVYNMQSIGHEATFSMTTGSSDFGEQREVTFTAQDDLNAQIVTIDGPSTMYADKAQSTHYKINVTVKNTGKTPWHYTVYSPDPVVYDFVVSDDIYDDPDHLAAMDLVKTRNKTTVQPGECVLYTFDINPQWLSDPGYVDMMHDVQFQMVRNSQDDIYFGPIGYKSFNVIQPLDNAQIISLDCPGTMPTEQTSKINVTLRNTGTTTWTSGFFLKMLGDSMSTPNELMAAEVQMERNKTTVAPGECVLYTFSVTPTWVYNMQSIGHEATFRMTTGSSDFGEERQVSFTAQDDLNAQIVSIEGPPSVIYVDQAQSAHYKINVTVKNTGKTPWHYTVYSPGPVVYDFVVSDDIYDEPDYLAAMDLVKTRNKTTVLPGECVLYTFDINPYWLSDPGYGDMLHALKFRMLRNSQSDSYFGPTGEKSFSVIQPSSPRVKSVTPADGSTGVSVSPTITATFSTDIDVQSLASGFIVRENSDYRAGGVVSYDSTTRTATFTPGTPLNSNAPYTCYINGVTSTQGYAVQAYSWSFQTVTSDTIPPRVIATSPMDDAEGVSPTLSRITATFSEDVNLSTLASGFHVYYWLNNTPVPGSLSYLNRVATFTPSVSLLDYVIYRVQVSGVKDMTGNPMASGYEWRFHMGSTALPAVTGCSPANGTMGVSTTPSINVYFDHHLNASLLHGYSTSFYVVNSTGHHVECSVLYVDQGSGLGDGSVSTVIASPSEVLWPNDIYELQVSGVKGTAGYAMEGTYLSYFSTSSRAGFVLGSSPENGRLDYPRVPAIYVYFDRLLDQASLKDHVILRDSANRVVPLDIVYHNTPGSKPGSVSYIYVTAVVGGVIANETFTLEVSGLKDTQGTKMTGVYQIWFTTEPGLKILDASPKNGAVRVPATISPSVHFNWRLNSSALDGHFVLRDGHGDVVPVRLTYGIDVAYGNDYSGSYVNITPLANSLDMLTDYTLEVSGVRAFDNSGLKGTYTISFSTTGIYIASISPAGGESNVPPATAITVVFYIDVDETTVKNGFTLRDQSNNNVAGTVSYGNKIATFTPAKPLDYGSVYSAHLAGIKDGRYAGTTYTAYSWGFYTAYPAPKVLSVTPAVSSTDQQPDTKISVTFDQDIDLSNLAGEFTVRGSMNNLIAGSTSYDSATRTATFTPAGSLNAGGDLYLVSLKGIKGLHNNVMPDYTWPFRTLWRKPYVVAVSPHNNQQNVAADTLITATFSEDMDLASAQSGFIVRDVDTGATIAGTVTVSGNKTTFTPAQPLPYDDTIRIDLQHLYGSLHNLMLDTYWSFEVSDGTLPDHNPVTSPGPTNPGVTPVPRQPFQTTIKGVGVSVDGNRITAPVGVDISTFLTNGHVSIPAGQGSLTVDITVGTPKNTGTITGVHVSDTSTGTLGGSPATVSATADLDGLPSGSVRFSATVSSATPGQISSANAWLSGDGKSIVGTPLALIDVQKSGFTNDDIVGGTAKITLTMKKPAGFDPSKTYTVIRHGDNGYEQLTATVKSTTVTDVTFEISSPNGFSEFLLAETAGTTAATPAPTKENLTAPIPVPSPSFLLISMALVAGVLLVVRKKRNG